MGVDVTGWYRNHAPMVFRRCRALLRDEWGQTINWGDVRDGFIFWSHGERSWIAREGNGVQVGDVGSSRNFIFNRA